MERQSIIRFIPELLLMSAVIAVSMACSFSVTASESTHPRDVWQSLSAAERKLPRDILVQQLQAQGRAVPSGWLRSAQAASRVTATESAQDAPEMYRLLGEDVESLQSVMALLGIEIRTISPSRGYIVVMLSDSQVLEVANYGAVRRIQRVKGPKAQGTTDAWVAHRFKDMDGAGEPSNIPGKPMLTGAGVVVGVISLPVTQADVTDLITDSSLPPLYDSNAPSSDSRLYLYRGYTKDDANDPDVDLDVLSTSGVDAGLNMVQVIRDIAPDAKIVLASPGLTSDPQDMANLIAALVAGRGTAGEPDYIPPVDIIVDDLDYLTQNPFEFDLISEAIAAAATQTSGALSVTAAGDDGHHQTTNSKSNVYLENFNSVTPPTGFFDDPLVNNLHRFANGSYYITVEQPLDDLCLFWTEDPGSSNEGNDLDLFVWNDDNGDGNVDYGTEIDFDTFFGAYDGPGYCLLESGEQISTGSRILIGDYNAQNTSRFVLVGQRADSSFVDQQGADDISATFSATTPGAIRGHAYSASALTIGGAPYIEENNAVVPFWDTDPDDNPETDGGALAGTVTANAYSSDGEITEQRFFWRKNEQNQWQALPITDSAARPQKPDLIAASAIGVRTVTQNSDSGTSTPATVADQTFYGTSASAAVIAGAAALYWEFREWQITEAVVSGPEVVPADILRAVQAASRSNTSTWNRTLGFGVLDAPRSLESPLPASDLTLTETQPGVLELTYKRAFNDTDANATFLYSVECTYPDNAELIDEVNIEPSDSGEGSAGSTKAPIILYPPNNRIGEEVTCEVTTTHPQAGSGWDGSGSDSATALTTALSAPSSVTMTSKSVGVTMQFAASPDDDAADLDYTASCTANGNAISGWPTADGAVTPHTSDIPSIYSYAANPGVAVACTVTAALERAGDPDLTLTAQSSSSVSAGSPVATTVTMTPDAGGVSVRWVVDPNLVTGVNASFTLLCTQGSNRLVDNLSVSGSGYFVEADQSAPVQCSVTTQISGTGISTINQSAVSASATAEEEQATGLPVWLLYIATQPE